MNPSDDTPYTDAQLESPAYRERLMRKLDCLIAVLELACKKVDQTLAGPEPDTERLLRIHGNLRNTLDVCRRAKVALERREHLPTDFPRELARLRDEPRQRALPAPRARAARPSNTELGSPEEGRRFRRLGPIQPSAIKLVDLDELTRLLQG